MPRHRNGPKAKCSFPLFFFITRSHIPYRPPVNTAKAKDSRVSLVPRNRPQAAISLISPPPKAPGTRIVMRRSGTLTTNMPRMREGRLVPGIVKMEMIPNTKTTITRVLGISILFRSTMVIIKRITTKIITVIAKQKLFNGSNSIPKIKPLSNNKLPYFKCIVLIFSTVFINYVTYYLN